MYFIKNFYKGIRYTLASIGLIAGGGVMAYAILMAAPIFAAGGGLYFVTSLLLIIDTAKVINDIDVEIQSLQLDIATFQQTQKELSLLRSEKQDATINQMGALNRALCHQITILVKSEATLEQENTNLAIEINKLKQQITKMESLKRKYEMESQRFQVIAKNIDNTNLIEEFATDMVNSCNTLKKENAELQLLVEKTQAQVILFEQTKKDYEEQTLKYRECLIIQSTLRGEYSQISQALSKHSDALTKLSERSRALVNNLIKASDMFKDFTLALASEENKADTTGTLESASEISEIVDRLNLHLTTQKV